MMRSIRQGIFAVLLCCGAVSPLMATTAPTVIVDDSAFQTVNEAGTYQYIDEDGIVVAETTGYITLLYYRSVTNPDEQEAINAYDITINAGYFDKLSDNDLRLLTKAHAWVTTNGMPVAITKIERQIEDKALGLYRVTFTTAHGTTTTVRVSELGTTQLTDTTEFFNVSQTAGFIWISMVVLLILLIIPFILIANYLYMRHKLQQVRHLLHQET